MRPDSDPRRPTVWLGLQAITVMVRVVVVVALGLALFLSVFLGYITVPLLAPGVLALGYLAVRVGRKLLRSL